MGRIPLDRDFAQVEALDKGRVVMPERFLKRVSWIEKELKKNSGGAEIEVLSVLEKEGHSIWLVDPSEGQEPHPLAKWRTFRLDESAFPFARDDKTFLSLIVIPAKIKPKPISPPSVRKGGEREYRMSIPIEQRQWLDLEFNHNEICVLCLNAEIHIWSMTRARAAIPDIWEVSGTDEE